jgi:hypothetical protein
VPCDQILVIDSSSLINMKTVIRVNDQWWFFDGLLARLKEGRVLVPREVAKEVSEIDHPDMPGAWAASTYELTPHPSSSTYESVQKVMEAASEVIEADAEMDKADPWVLGLALDLVDRGLEPVVVTDDNVDRPRKIGLTTAAKRLGLACIGLPEALEWLDDHPPEA